MSLSNDVEKAQRKREAAQSRFDWADPSNPAEVETAVYVLTAAEKELNLLFSEAKRVEHSGT